MVIKKLEIEGFGKFVDTSFEFDKGVNLIYGNNEDGKTTLMSFVKMILYSTSAKTEKSSDLFKSLRKKYRPWNGSKMSGTMEFESDGLTYRIHKDFLKSEASDKTTIFCITTGENIQIENKNDPGEYFLGMTLDEFERSIFMGQSGGFTADSSSDSLAMRISNLSVSGDESISHERITKRLSDAAEELVSKSRKKGMLVEAEARLEALKSSKEQLLLLENEQRDTEAEIMQLTKEISALEGEIGALSDKDKLENAKKDLQAYYTLQNKLNLLRTVKGQLSAYDAEPDALQNYICTAKELNDRIEENLALIQEATLRKTDDIPEEECAKLEALDKKCGDIRHDLDITRGRIAVLWTEYQKQTVSALRSAKIGALSVLATSIILAAIAFFAVPFGAFAGLGTLILGTGLFLALFLTANKRTLTKLAVQLSKRDYEGEIRNLICFTDSLVSKNPEEIEAWLSGLLADTASELENRLEDFGIANLDALKSKSGTFRAEQIKEITDELAVQKDNFVALSNTIKLCNSYSAAKILYVELSESLEKDKSIKQEIETICRLADIKNTDENFVSKKITELCQFVQNAPILPDKGSGSITEIRKELSEKRELLNHLQAKLKRPEIGMAELLKLIKEARDKVNELRQRYDEISIAIDVMNEAITDTNKGLGSHLSQKAGEYISKISGGRYCDLIVPRDLNVETRAEGSQAFHEWKYLSTGAIDKVYLALRLAMTDILADAHGPLPLFLDDIFSQYDDNSLELALVFLKDYIKENNSVSQLMLFTCHANIFEIAKKIFPDTTNILL